MGAIGRGDHIQVFGSIISSKLPHKTGPPGSAFSKHSPVGNGHTNTNTDEGYEMNINRKRQWIRRKVKSAEAAIESMRSKTAWPYWLQFSQAVAICSEADRACRSLAQSTTDPMDVLDITRIGADFPQEIPSFKDPKTDVVQAISDWNVDLFYPGK